MSKVILLAPTPPPIGGIAAWTVRMMNAKLPDDWEVEVVDEKIVGKREFFGDKLRLDIKSEIKRCHCIWRGLKDALKDNEAKVVHACIAANTLPVLREFVSACITKRKKKKFIIHFRCTVPNMVKSKINRIALKLLCNKADCVMLLNQQSEEFIKGITETKTVTIPNFVDADEIMEHREINENIKRVLYVGGVIESKGCMDLMEVANHFPDIEFKLIGNSDEASRKRAQGIPNVVLAGSMQHDEITKEMRKADVFMFLTFFSGEGFSNSLAEAMASGLPCIATDWAANKDMIEDKGGIIVPIHGINETIEALKKMQSKNEREKFSRYNIQKSINCYSDISVQRKYVDCYEAVINE